MSEDVLKEIKKDLQSIKLIYLDNVITSLKSISENIDEQLNESMVRIKDFFETNTNFFIQLNEGNDNILSKIDILSENQADQLETIAQTRDTLESIVKIDLNSLKTDFNIFRNEFLSSHIQLGEKINDVTTQVKNIEKAIQNEQEKHFQLLSVLAEKMEKQGENTLTEVKKIAAYVLKKKKEEGEME